MCIYLQHNDRKFYPSLLFFKIDLTDNVTRLITAVNRTKEALKSGANLKNPHTPMNCTPYRVHLILFTMKKYSSIFANG
jgi:hypothetical protein